MKIGFVLPGSSRFPSGGFKVVFEYANFLVARGHDVTIFFDCSNGLLRFHLPESLRRLGNRYLVHRRPAWFALNPRVRKVCIFGVSDETICDGDAIVATAVGTAKPVSKLSLSKGDKYYLIQDYENWEVSDDVVNATYCLGMKNIVVSQWLEDIVRQHAPEPPVLISNSIDGDVFNIRIPLTNREPKSLIFHWRKEKNKGCIYALKLIEKLHRLYPDFRFTAVSSQTKPKNFPDYINYVHNATPNEVAELNNQNALFICTSVAEGFGLPGLEGMACGCTLVSFGYQGVFDYAVDGENALISPVEDVNAMMSNVKRLIADDSLRIRLAQNGYLYAMKRTLSVTGKQLENLLVLAKSQN